MDFRPATGQFYAVSNGSRYTIHRATGAATRLGADGAFTLTGTSFGVDFNPVPDRLRVVSDADFGGSNFRLSKLNQFNGDFVQDEMVRAFISSIEYRRRFGQ